MEYGLTPNGFIIKDFQTIKQEIEMEFRKTFSDSIDLSPDSVFGQIINNFAIKHFQQWQILQEIYSSFNPNYAEGVSLDNICSLVNITRFPSTQSEVRVVLYGDFGTRVLKGHQLSQVGTGKVFILRDSLEIDGTNAYEWIITFKDGYEVSAGDRFDGYVNGKYFEYTAQEGDTKNSLLVTFKQLIDAWGFPITTVVDENTLSMIANDVFTPFSIQWGGDFLDLVKGGVCGDYVAQEFGAIPVPINSITIITQPVAGLNLVKNPAPGIIGRNLETDDELRLRRKNFLLTSRYSTEEAIRSRILQEVPNISYCQVISNRSNVVDAKGRPPHSVETIVMGASSEDIAKKIWEVFPAGIGFFGSEEVTVLDSSGNPQIVKFSRVANKYVWLKVEIRVSGEEFFPANGRELIRQNIVEWALKNFTVNTDIIHQKLFIPVYSVPGILSATVEIGISSIPDAPPQEYVQTNIPISETEIARFDVSRIQVTAI